MYGQTTGNVAANFDHRAEQAVVAFSDADKALQFADNQVGSWKGCAGKTIHMQVNGNPVSWTFGALAEVNALPVLFRTQEGGNGFACAHTMTARVNIVIDLAVCSADTAAVTGQAAALATAITDRIPT
jgi:hypothetical protein